MLKFCRLMCVLAVILTATYATAQINPNEDQGLKPYDTFHGGDLDSISVTSGGLSLHIPLASFPQRGNLDLSFMVSFSNKQWYVAPAQFDRLGHQTAPARWAPMPNTGVQIVSSVDWWLNNCSQIEPGDPNNPGGPEIFDWSDSVSSPDGSSHLFGNNSTVFVGEQFPVRSLDASGILRPDAQTVVLPNGTRYTYTGGSSCATPRGRIRGGVQPSSVTDANGNQITIGATGWTDTMGRLLPGSRSSAVQGIQPGVPTTDLSQCPAGTTSALLWSVPGVASVNSGIRTFYFCYSMFTLAPNLPTTTNSGNTTGYGPVSTSLLSAVVLPDSTKWTFTYDSYGDVLTVGFPTGGSLTYSYILGPPNASTDTSASTWVSSRIVDANDGTGGHKWSYNYQPSGSFLYGVKGVTTVTSPDGNDVVHTVGPGVTGSGCPGFVYQTQYFQGATGGPLLKTVQNQYTCSIGIPGSDLDAISINGVPTQVTTNFPGGQTAKVVNTYDPLFNDPNAQPVRVGSVLQKDEYDFSGVLARSTLTRYQWQDNATYFANNFVSLPEWSTVYNGAAPPSTTLPACSSTGTPACISQSKYAYDEGTRAASGITHAAPPAGDAFRGNMTTASRWLDTAGGFVSGTSTYFDTGMKQNSTDALGRVTSYTYPSTFQGAYLTQTNLPDTQMPDSGAPVVHHIIQGNYDFNTGLLTSFTDENGQPFSYAYDIMLRLTQGNHPDQGVTKFFYPDPNTVERQRLISGTTYDDYKVKFDGVGRGYQTLQFTPDCAGYIKVDTLFDQVGRAKSVSNPYCLTNETTYGTIQTQYDALSRPTITTKQDGSTTRIVYNDAAGDSSGPPAICTTATDESGRKRQSCTDAFGRLIKVIEPNPGIAATKATGSVVLAGNEQSIAAQAAAAGTGSATTSGAEQSTTTQPATSGTGSATTSGAEQSTAGTAATSGTGSATTSGTEQTTSGTPATSATGTVTIAGLEQSTVIDPCSDQGLINPCPRTIYDTGNVTITVNGSNWNVRYARGSTPTLIASAFVSTFPSDPVLTFSSSGATVTIVTKATGTAANFSLSASSTTDDPTDFAPGSFTATRSGPTLTGGNNAIAGVSDTGSAWVTVNGTQYTTSYGAGSTPSSVASGLAGVITTNSTLVNATVAGTTISLTAKTGGAATNYSLTSGSSTSQPGTFAHPSFTLGVSGASLTGGANAVAGVSDTGNAWITVNGTQYTTPYAAGSTPSSVASGLAGVITTNSTLVNATVAGPTVSLTSKTTGAATNYSLTSGSSTSQPGTFTHPSFTVGVSGAALTGGSNAITGVSDTGSAWITVNGVQFTTPYGAGSTTASVATALAGAVNTGSTVVTATAAGTTVSLTAKTTGATTNYSLASGSSTSQPGTFTHPSFTVGVSGAALTGGHNAVSAVNDSGSVSVTVNGTGYSTTYGAGDTSSTIAGRLAALITAGPDASASAAGSTINLTSKIAGTIGDYAVSASSTWNSASFVSPSFTATPSGGLTGATDSGGINNNPLVTTYQYNARGDMLCVHQKATDTTPDVACTGTTPPTVPASWRQRFFTYDSLSRILTAMNPETNSTGSIAISYSYDAVDNLKTKTEPAPNQQWGTTPVQMVTINYTYDALNRLLDTTYSDGTTQNSSHRYDYSSFWGVTLLNPIGREVAATAANGTIGYLMSYDPMGRVATTTQCNPGVSGCKTFTAGYDKLGDLTSLVYPANNFTVTYGYDTAARLISAIDSAGVIYAQTPTYWAAGVMKEFISPNFANNKYHVELNNRLQPKEIWAGSSQSASLFDKQYSYGPAGADNGNIFTITNLKDSTRTQSFDYDSLNRLLSAGDNGHWANTYVYDAWGNLTNKNVGVPAGENLQKAADVNNHLSGLGYDVAGNVINDGLGKTFTFDAENRITVGAGVTYTYDADGRRIAKSSGTNYWYGPNGAALAETDSSGAWTNYILFGGRRLARNVNGDIKYYITDHLHSTGMFVDKAGTAAAIQDDNDFYPWGGVVPGVGKSTSTNTIKFTGQYRDAESQLDYFGARYYSNINGRFMSPDWASKPTSVPYAQFGDPQSLNLYSYVTNGPINRVDAGGHFGDDPFGTFDTSTGDGLDFSNMAGSWIGQKREPENQNQEQSETQQQDSSSGGKGLWHHLSNLFHFHSWNYEDPQEKEMRESVSWYYVLLPESKSESEGNPYTAGVNDAVGVGLLVQGSEKLGNIGGKVGAFVSIANDPSPKNIGITVLGLIPGPDVPVAFGSLAWDFSEGASSLINQIFSPNTPLNVDDGNGHLVPNPAFTNECQAAGGPC